MTMKQAELMTTIGEVRRKAELMTMIDVVRQQAELFEVYDWIVAHPDQHRQGSWASRFHWSSWRSPSPGTHSTVSTEDNTWSCNTGMCFAGAKAHLDGLKFDFVGDNDTTDYCVFPGREERIRIDEYAADQFQLNQEDKDLLFQGDNTVEDIAFIISMLVGVDPRTREPVDVPENWRERFWDNEDEDLVDWGNEADDE
jgi:hypothetical protein